MRTTLLGSLLDAARLNVARGAGRRAAVRARARVYRESDGGPDRRRRPAPRGQDHRCRRAPRARRAAGRPRCTPPSVARAASRRAPTSSRPRACSRRCSATLRVSTGASSPPREPFLHPGRSARGPRRRDASRSAGSARCTRSSRATWDLDAAAAFALDLGAVARAPTPCPRYRDLTSFPALRQDLAVVVPTTSRPRRVLRSSREAGGELLARRARVRRLPRRAGGRGPHVARARLQFRAPDRTLTDEDVAARARARSSPRCATSWGASCVAERRSSPARVGLRRRARRAADRRHPDFELAAVTARSDAGRRLDELYPHHRVAARRSTSSTSTATATSTPRSSPTRTAPPRRSSPRCASAGVRSSTSAPTSACATARPTSDWYVEHPHPELLAEAVYGLPERYREGSRGADLVASPGCFPTAAVLALAPLARADYRRRRRSTRRPASRGAGRERHARRRTSSPSTRTSRPTGSARHRHMPEIEQELGRRRAGTCGSRSCRTCCRSTRASSSPAT